MTIHSFGYSPSTTDKERSDQDFTLFFQHLDLFQKHSNNILECREYFFCSLSFARCSWPYISGDGPICLGYLLLGWRRRILAEPCPDCAGKVLVTAFGGSPLSGSNSWAGFCECCLLKKYGRDTAHKPFSRRINFIRILKQRYPEVTRRTEDYQSHQFDWKDGLIPVMKQRVCIERTVVPVSLAVLLRELTASLVEGVEAHR